MDVWLVWLLLAAALGVAELFTLSAALGLLGGAAAVTAGGGRAGRSRCRCSCSCSPPAPAAGIWLVRPVVLRHLHAPPAQRFGVDALVGRTAQRRARRSAARAARCASTARSGARGPCDPYDPAYVIPAGRDRSPSWPSAAPPRSYIPRSKP